MFNLNSLTVAEIDLIPHKFKIISLKSTYKVPTNLTRSVPE